MSKQFPVISSPSQYHQPIPSHPKPTVESSIANPAESWFFRGHEGANRTGDQERDLAAIKSQIPNMSKQFISKHFQSFPIIFQSFPVCLNMSRLFSIIRIPNLSSGILSRKLILSQRVCQIPKVLISVAPVRFWRFRIPLGPWLKK